jgi:hypothetical protein
VAKLYLTGSEATVFGLGRAPSGPAPFDFHVRVVDPPRGSHRSGMTLLLLHDSGMYRCTQRIAEYSIANDGLHPHRIQQFFLRHQLSGVRYQMT